ncbi:hypothetical protein Pan181_51730 [Aeoliella mucimassa]|uniref:Uncharacterized protein n=1 Tax=Aeoliella mucimassa TaxID=2527972 RepID=A0A518AW35_9BACT|nr:hypothetical protein Pan181_51730 [Aeoliella mucimassa]
MQLVTYQRLAIDSQRKNRFPLDAFWEMGIYSGAKTTGFVEYAQIQFSHRWVNWESICPTVGIYSVRWESIPPSVESLAPLCGVAWSLGSGLSDHWFFANERAGDRVADE